jgi:succinyl-diaminopimelate desuccinylase
VNSLDNQSIFGQVEALQQEMVDALMALIRVSAVGPEGGGAGETQKGAVLVKLLSEIGFDKIERFDAPDSRIPSGKRPNIVAYLNGESPERLCIVSHLDVVPSGETSLWTVTEPFEPLVRDGCVFGRGSEDNGQSLVASLFAVKALRQLGIKPRRTVVLVFVADEEQGSKLGIQYLLAQGVFRCGDLVLVPDSGSSKGDFIEIAEKSILWFKITTVGKQTHGSLPDKGLNAHRVGMQVALALDTLLHGKYNVKNEYFLTEPLSTFEPTRKEKNVDSINIVPGEDVFYFDCRILPDYDVEQVWEDIKAVALDFEAKTGAKITVETVQKEPAPEMTAADSPMVVLLQKALKVARGVDAAVGGIGGGTCAAYFRRAGVPAVAWSTIEDVAHQPDEYARIPNLVADTKVFALLAVL